MKNESLCNIQGTTGMKICTSYLSMQQEYIMNVHA